MLRYELETVLLNDMPEESREFYEVRHVHQTTQQAEMLIGIIGSYGYIAGSFATWTMSFSYERVVEPSDIDVFAVSVDAAASLAQKIFATGQYASCSQNDVAYTLEHGAKFPENKSVQIVKPRPEWNCFPQDFLLSFDLDLCSAVILDHEFGMEHINASNLTHGKILRMNNPLRSLRRVMKYHKRGAEFSDHELLKLFRFWSELPVERQQEMIDKAYEEAQPVDDTSDNWTDDNYFDGE